MFNIYALIDPREPENIRYVGKAVNKTRRLIEHCSPSTLKAKTHKNHWIKSLLAQKTKPIMIDLATCFSAEGANQTEIQCIKQFRDWGYKLVNGTDGGDGASLGSKNALGHKNPFKGKKRPNSCIPKSAQFKQNMLGNKYAIGNKSNTGRKHSPETIIKMKIAANNRWSNKWLPYVL